MTFDPPTKKESFQKMTGVRFIGDQNSARNLLERYIQLLRNNETTPVALTREFSAWVFRPASRTALRGALTSDLKHNGLRLLFPENVEDFEVLLREQGLLQWLDDAAKFMEFVGETAKDHRNRDSAPAWRPLLASDNGANESDDE
jgi:hypothetical protein